MEEGGPFSNAAKNVGQAIDSVKSLFDRRKNNGYTIGQKKRPASPPRPSRRPSPSRPSRIDRIINKAIKNQVANPVRQLTAKINKALKKPLIARRPSRRPAPRPSRRPIRRPLAAPRPRNVDNLWHYERHIPKVCTVLRVVVAVGTLAVSRVGLLIALHFVCLSGVCAAVSRSRLASDWLEHFYFSASATILPILLLLFPRLLRLPLL